MMCLFFEIMDVIFGVSLIRGCVRMFVKIRLNGVVDWIS